MLTMIWIVVLAIGFAIFATQNTISIPLALGSYVIPDLPLYIVIGVTLLLGLFMSAIISFLNSIAVAFQLHGKDSAIKDSNRSISDLTNKVHHLEVENAQLKGELHEERKERR